MRLAAFAFLSCVVGVSLSCGPRSAERLESAGGPAIDFERDAAGKLPGGFVSSRTGSGGAPEWAVKEEAGPAGGKKVLAQTSADKTGSRFPMAIYQGLKAKDVEISASIKPVSGEVDQAGGVVVRYRDKDNYYVVRANALEDNVRFYKVEAGKRTQLAGKNKVEVPSGKWSRLKLIARGSHFEVHFDGKPLFEADDPTFKEAGLTGLWTKADSVTYFDDVTIVPLDAR